MATKLLIKRFGIKDVRFSKNMLKQFKVCCRYQLG